MVPSEDVELLVEFNAQIKTRSNKLGQIAGQVCCYSFSSLARLAILCFFWLFWLLLLCPDCILHWKQATLVAFQLEMAEEMMARNNIHHDNE